MATTRHLPATMCLMLAGAIGLAVSTPSHAGTIPAHVDASAVNPPIAYPAFLQDQGVQGTAIMRVRVAYSGRPTDVQFVQSTGNQTLDLAAESGVMNWHYVPANEDGDPVTDWATVQIDFKLPAQPSAAPSSVTRMND